MAYSTDYNSNLEYQAHIKKRAEDLIQIIMLHKGLLADATGTTVALTESEKDVVFGAIPEVARFVNLVTQPVYQSDYDEELKNQKKAKKSDWVHITEDTPNQKQLLWDEIVQARANSGA